MDNVPRDIGKTWIDPVPGGGTGGRHLAAEFQTLAAPPEMPAWKKASFGGNKASYGKKTQLSLLEQRQGLPIYKLRDNLVQAVKDNQVKLVPFSRPIYPKNCFHSKSYRMHVLT